MNLFKDVSSYPKVQAQQNLSGRTHYVDSDTLRYHKSRILKCSIVHGGLLLAIVESVAMDIRGTKRGFRPVVFDIFGNTIDRPSLDDCYSTRKAAEKAMWRQVDSIDAQAHTLAAIERHKAAYAREMDDLAVTVQAIGYKVAA